VLNTHWGKGGCFITDQRRVQIGVQYGF